MVYPFVFDVSTTKIIIINIFFFDFHCYGEIRWFLMGKMYISTFNLHYVANITCFDRIFDQKESQLIEKRAVDLAFIPESGTLMFV